MTKTLAQLAGQAGQLLKQHGLMLTTAESCTGGGLGYWITSIAGSSDWFERGFVTYSNAAKMEMLGVSAQTLETAGAVSEETAREMAEGALKHSHAEVSIAITGIAGPVGGSAQKPVGMVFIAWAGRSFPTEVEMNIFPGNRQEIRSRSMTLALTKLCALITSSG